MALLSEEKYKSGLEMDDAKNKTNIVLNAIAIALIPIFNPVSNNKYPIKSFQVILEE